MAARTFNTHNDMPADRRASIVALINKQLLDLIDLYTQTKYAHWNVKGPHFIGLHLLFDKLAEEVEEAIDEVAERAASLGGVALGTARHVASHTRLTEFPGETFDFDGVAVVAALVERFASVGKTTRAAIDEATKLEDTDTADLFTGVSRDLDKSTWFLEAHLQK